MDQDPVAEKERCYRIGDLLLHTGTQKVSRDGVAIALPSLSFRMLLVLAEAAPNVLSTDQLIDRVWGGRVVSAETVTQRIKLLRQAIGDDASEPRYIGLVRRGGYRMLADVLEVDPGIERTVTRGVVGELSRRRVPQVAFVYIAVAWTITEAMTFIIETLPLFPSWASVVAAIAFIAGFPVAMFLAWRFDVGPDGVRRAEPLSTSGRMTIAGALGLLVVVTGGLSYLLIDTLEEDPTPDAVKVGAAAPEDVVALLPFSADAADPAFVRLGSSLNDELRDGLRNLGLKMVARTSSRAFRDQAMLMTDISQRLGAGTLIEGSVSQDGSDLVVTVVMVDGASGLERWSGRYAARQDNLPDLQIEITNAIAAELAIDTAQVRTAAASADPQAYNLILLARHFEQQVRDRLSVDLATLDRAIELYRQAVSVDPTSPLAHSRLAGALLYRGDVGAAEAPIFKALELNPDLADVQYTLGLYYWQKGSSLGGEAFARAVQLNANHADALAAHAKWIWHQQDFDLPGPYFERAKQVDPLSLIRYAELGTFYGYQNDLQGTLAVAAEIEQRFRTPQAMEVIARLYELVGRLDEAVAWAWQGRQLAPSDIPDPTWQLAELYGRLGMHDVVEELIPGPDISKYYWQRRYPDLIDVAEEAIIERPEEAKIYYQLAFAYTTQNAHSAAARILRLAGLPDGVYSDSRRADGVEAMATYAVALQQLGESQEAKEVASWHRGRMQTALETKAADSWWPNVYQACQLMTLGKTSIALERLDALLRSHGFAWEPFLRDAVCFRALQAHPAYQKVLLELASRKQKLREQLPLTLAEHGLGSTERLLADI